MNQAFADHATPDCCPKCGEERNLDVILTGTQRSFYCTVCSHAWAPDSPVEPRVI